MPAKSVSDHQLEAWSCEKQKTWSLGCNEREGNILGGARYSPVSTQPRTSIYIDPFVRVVVFYDPIQCPNCLLLLLLQCHFSSILVIALSWIRCLNNPSQSDNMLWWNQLREKSNEVSWEKKLWCLYASSRSSCSRPLNTSCRGAMVREEHAFFLLVAPQRPLVDYCEKWNALTEKMVLRYFFFPFLAFINVLISTRQQLNHSHNNNNKNNKKQ